MPRTVAWLLVSLGRLLRRDCGATVVEYAILLGFLVMMIIVAVTAFGQDDAGIWARNAELVTEALSPGA